MDAALAADAWLRRFRAALVALLGATVAGIGALAFWTSFEAIKQYANTSNGIDRHHDWAIPLLVDSFIVVATGADLWFTTTKQQRRAWEQWWPKALLAGTAAVSFVLNIAHVQASDWAARGVAAIPPAALVLGVELLMLVLRRATSIRVERLAVTQDQTQADAGAGVGAVVATLERNTPAERNRPQLPPRKRNRAATSKRNPQGGTATAERPAVSQAEPAGRNGQGGTVGAEPTSRYGQAVAWVRAERAAGRPPTGTQVAAEFHVSSGLGRRAIREADANQGTAAAQPSEPTLPTAAAQPSDPTSPAAAEPPEPPSSSTPAIPPVEEVPA
jgi:hypothetical protein